jgi:hypothetical protein
MLSRRLTGSGKTIADGLAVYDFSAVRYFWIGAAALSSLPCAALWKAGSKSPNAAAMAMKMKIVFVSLQCR